MQVLVHDGHEVIRNLQFEDSAVSIGSQADCAIYLPDMRVAMQQAVLVPIPGGGWMLDSVDLTHKTILNGRQVVTRTEVEHGDEIIISNFLLKVFHEYQGDVEITKTATREEVSRIRQYPLPPGSLLRKPNEPFTIPCGVERQFARFGFELRDCTDMSKLMELTLKTLLDVFDARLVWFGARRQDYGRLEFVEGRSAEGTTTIEPSSLETYTYRCLERTQFIVVPRSDEEHTRSAMAVPLVSQRGRLGVLYVDSKPDSGIFDLGHLDLLCLYSAAVAVQLEAIVQEQIRLQEAIRAGELSFIREIQDRLDPTNVPQWDQLQFAVYCKPGLDHAGDVYDVMRMPNGLATFFIAHVSGPPTRTAMALVEMRAAFRVAALHADPPPVLLREINWLLGDDRTPCSAVGCAIVINPKTGAAEYATAGGIGAIVVDDCGEPKPLAEPGLPDLGSIKNYAYTSRSLRIMPEETLVLYTPGAFAVRNEQGQALGQARLTEALCDGFGIPASDSLNNLLTDLGGHFKQGRQPDDITFVFMHRTEA